MATLLHTPCALRNLARRTHPRSSLLPFRTPSTTRIVTMATAVDHTNPITLSRFILAEKEIQTNSDLSILFSSIELACKVIASAVRRAGLTGLYGLDGSENSTGDAVKKLDLLANDIFINSLKVPTRCCNAMACFCGKRKAHEVLIDCLCVCVST